MPGDLDQEEYDQLQHLAETMSHKDKDELQHVSRFVLQDVTSLQCLFWRPTLLCVSF